MKKLEKGDAWIISKKPMQGHSCASCEHYIGDLSPASHTFVPYNKLQTKETEKQYRVITINNIQRLQMDFQKC